MAWMGFGELNLRGNLGLDGQEARADVNVGVRACDYGSPTPTTCNLLVPIHRGKREQRAGKP
ncbi:hypothetical protein GBA52_002235 [Prunus armeniaca]|nr:hypothetical protein GBA52_002235 [Prunus armeniaca]